MFLVEPGNWHKFSTLDGVIFEEVSTTHYNDDSFYQDEYIANLPKIEGFEVKKIYRLNRNLLAAYMDSSGNRLVFKLNESSATWKRILFKTKVPL